MIFQWKMRFSYPPPHDVSQTTTLIYTSQQKDDAAEGLERRYQSVIRSADPTDPGSAVQFAREKDPRF